MIQYVNGDFMRCIFLDFDGVINNWHQFDGVSIDNAIILKQIVDLTNAKIIVTSSNKYSIQQNNGIDYYNTAFYKEYVQPLSEIGIDIYDITPFCNRDRTLEIQKYLADNEVKEFVIVDDELVSESLQDHQVFCDLYRGLQPEHIEPIINILNGKLGFYPETYNRQETSSELILRINKYYKKQ